MFEICRPEVGQGRAPLGSGDVLDDQVAADDAARSLRPLVEHLKTKAQLESCLLS